MMRFARFAGFVALALCLGLPLLVLAQTVPTPDDPSAFASVILGAVAAKNWAVLGIVGTIGLVWAVRRLGAYLPGSLGTFMVSSRGGALLALVGGIATALATTALTGGPWTLKVVIDALVNAVGAAGGWVVVRRIVYGEEPPPAPSSAAQKAAA